METQDVSGKICRRPMQTQGRPGKSVVGKVRSFPSPREIHVRWETQRNKTFVLSLIAFFLFVFK